MRALVARDLADATVAGLSADRRFATAYNAALQAANMAIACTGYRVTAKTGHHKVAIDSVKLAGRCGTAGSRHRRRGARRRGVRSRSGAEHRPWRIAVHDSRQFGLAGAVV